MTLTYHYPHDLADYARNKWPEGRSIGLSHELFREALSVAYHASLTSEEARPTRFRLLLTRPESLPENGVPNDGVLRLVFDRLRAATADDLRQVSPAAPFETSLIGVHAFDGQLRIWGIAHSGPAWLAPTWGGRNQVPNWTYDPIVHAIAPGHLAVRCAGELIGALEQGALVDTLMDVFDSRWLPALFANERQEITRKHAERQSHAATPVRVEPSLIGRVGQHMVRRAIQLLLGTRHGGLILMADVPLGAPGEHLTGLHFKYRFDGSEPPMRYRTVLFQILDMLASRFGEALARLVGLLREDASPQI